MNKLASDLKDTALYGIPALISLVLVVGYVIFALYTIANRY